MIQLNVTGQVINPGANYTIIADSVDFVQIKFNFSQEWEGLTCTAQFTQNENTYNKLLDETFIITVPAEIVQGSVDISVFGVLDGDTITATTKAITIPVLKSGFKTDGELTIPSTPTLLAQLIDNMSDFSLADATTDDLAEGSTNLYYPLADKTKLTGIEAGANALPSKIGLTDKILALNSNGVLEWVANVIGLPSMTDNSAKFLVTDGNVASWSNKIERDINDANTVFTVNQKNTSATGKLFDFQVGGASKVYASSIGTQYATYFTPTSSLFGLVNISSGANANIYPASTGTIISRDIADANSALSINLKNAGSTGNIVDFQFGGVSKGSISSAGYMKAVGFVGASLQNAGGSSYGYFSLGSGGILASRNQADTNSVLTVNLANANATGPIQIFQKESISKSYVANNGSFTGPHSAADGTAGVTGSFTTADNKTITVKDGLIVSIV